MDMLETTRLPFMHTYMLLDLEMANSPMLETAMFSGMVSLSSLRLMAQLRRVCTCWVSPSSSPGKGMMRSLMQEGRRGYDPVTSTSSAGARLKLGAQALTRVDRTNWTSWSAVSMYSPDC